MDSKLASVFDQAEAKRKKLLSLVSGLSDKTFYYAPPEKWSISQILIHLILAEQLSLRYIKKKSLGIEQAGDTNMLDDLKYQALRVSQRLPLKYKAPKVLGDGDPSPLSLEEIIDKWNHTRNELKAFLEGMESGHINRKIYKHAVAGRLNILHAVDFFNEHLTHHLPQIRRLINTTQ
jgi:hypothetical protein